MFNCGLLYSGYFVTKNNRNFFIAFKQKNQDNNLSALFEEYEKEKIANNQLKLDLKTNDLDLRNSDLIPH